MRLWLHGRRVGQALLPGSRRRPYMPSGRSALGRMLTGTAGALFLAWCMEPVPQALGETLNEALGRAYLDNPTLNADRARQRATDEQVPQALSGWRPTVTTNAQYGYLYQSTKSQFSSGLGSTRSTFSSDPRSFSIELDQPIFSGFRTVNQTRAAESDVAAGKAQLTGTEQQTLFDAVQAFMNVIRDRRVVLLRRKDVQVLQAELESTRARFEVGDNTRTDVAQAEARVAEAQSNLAVAEANLAISVGTYIRVIGQPPGELTFPPEPKRLMPATIDKAIEVAEANNPQVIRAQFIEQASRYNVELQKGALLPTVSLNARYSRGRDQNPQTLESESTTVTGQFSMPLYQAGREYANIRQAKQTQNQRQIQVVESRRGVRENVVRAWNALQGARQTIVSTKEAVRAQTLAAEGVRLEAEAGTRTTLDVLDAERELVNAQVSEVVAERDAIVAAYQLVAAIGRLTASQLGLAVPIYNPDIYYERVRDKWIGFDTPSPE